MPVREPNRSPEQVKRDVETSGQIFREDIYDILHQYPTKEQAVEGLLEWLDTIDPKLLEYQGEPDQGKWRLISDVDSYGIDWPDAKKVQRPLHEFPQGIVISKGGVNLKDQERQLVEQIKQAREEGKILKMQRLTQKLINIQNQIEGT